MRHKNAYKKLGRTTKHREELGRKIVSALFLHESITTTLPKAKYFRKLAEKLITLAKSGKTLHNYRNAITDMQDKKAVKKLFDDIAPRYADIKGGYTRILKLGGSRWLDESGKWAMRRLGDNGVRAVLELTKKKETPKPSKAKDAKKATKTAKA